MISILENTIIKIERRLWQNRFVFDMRKKALFIETRINLISLLDRNIPTELINTLTADLLYALELIYTWTAIEQHHEGTSIFITRCDDFVAFFKGLKRLKRRASSNNNCNVSFNRGGF